MHPIIKFGEIKIVTFSFFLLLAVFICVVYYIVSKKYNINTYSKIMKSMIFAVGFSWFGGATLSAFTLTLQNGLSINENLFKGFVFYGALIGAVFGLILNSFIKRDCLLSYLDVYMGILPLGQAIGRIGCYFNGCCYGKYYNGLFSVKYFIDGVITYVFPTWFLESIYCFLLFLFLQYIIKTSYRGFYTAMYLIAYSLFRFSIEFMRGDEIRGIWNGMSTSQIISIILFFIGWIVLIYALKNRKINIFLTKGGD